MNFSHARAKEKIHTTKVLEISNTALCPAEVYFVTINPEASEPPLVKRIRNESIYRSGLAFISSKHLDKSPENYDILRL